MVRMSCTLELGNRTAVAMVISLRERNYLMQDNFTVNSVSGVILDRHCPEDVRPSFKHQTTQGSQKSRTLNHVG